MSDLQPAIGDETFGEHLVENLFATWIDPDLERRASGLTRAHIYRAVVEFPPFGEAAIVRINDEVSLQARAVASAPIKKGEPVSAENISSLEAIDNLLSAAELTVQAQMLAESQSTKFHDVRDRWLRENERLGNAPEGFFVTLQRLRRERAAARYGAGTLRLTADEMPALIATVRSMVQHAANQIGLVAADSTSGERGADS